MALRYRPGNVCHCVLGGPVSVVLCRIFDERQGLKVLENLPLGSLVCFCFAYLGGVPPPVGRQVMGSPVGKKLEVYNKVSDAQCSASGSSFPLWTMKQEAGCGHLQSRMLYPLVLAVSRLRTIR